MVSKEFQFIHEGKLVMAEIDFYPGLTASLDTIEVLGEITDEEETVYEISDKVLIKVFRDKFFREVEEERNELIAEKMGMRSIRVEI